jgi:hypothetical protein
MTREEDDIVAKLNASDRATSGMALTLGAAVLLLVAVYVAAFFTGQTALLQSQVFQIVIGVAFTAIIVFVIARFGRKFRPDAYRNAADPRIARRRIDAHHRYWRWSLVSGLAATSMWGLNFNNLVRFAREDQGFALVTGGAMILVMALFSVFTIVGPGWFSRELHAILNDEFVRDLRARTARLGYLTMMAAVAAALLTTIWRPNLALPALAWAFYAGYALPTLYYVVADWRASREK